MKFQPLPIYGGSYADDTKSWSAQDVLGWLPSNAEVPGTKTEGMFKTPPGLRPFAEVPPTGGGEFPLIPSPPVRGATNAEGKCFVVIGTQLYQLSNAGVFIPIGTIPGTGRVIFSHNQVSLGNQVLAVNGSAGYIYDTRDQTFQRITDPGYPGAFVATFIDGYFVQISANRRFAFNSDVANGLEYNTLDRFTSEFSPDLLVSLVASNNELFLLSETSGEFFENTGAAQQPFRSKRITMDRGCAGAYTVAKADNTVFWLGNNGYFYVLNGYAPQRISTRAIEQSILGKNWKQCFAFAWEDAGHTVIYWTFPDGLTWGYDTSTGLWHRRESYGLNRWRVNTMTFWNQEWYAGDFQYGRIWKMDWNYALEGDQEFPSERTTAVIHDNQNRIIIPRLELLMQVGQEETVPVLFPEQPEAPVLTIGAPDGNVGTPWGPFTYTATGGTPPYSFSLRPGDGFPLGVGPMNSAGVVAAGTPTTIQTVSPQIRVTDSTGLYDQEQDEIIIGAVLIGFEWQYTGTFGNNVFDICWGVTNADEELFLVCTSGVLSDGQIFTSPDGDNWLQRTDGSSNALRSCDYGTPGGDPLFVVSRDSANVLTSSDCVTWTNHTTSDADAYLVTLWDGEFFIRMGLNNSAERSATGIDGWASHPRPTSNAATVGITFEFGGNRVVMAFCTSGAIHRSTDSGLTWGSITPTADPFAAGNFTSAAVNEDGSIIRAYKFSTSVLTTYTSTDGGATFTAQQDTVGSSYYEAGPSLFRNGNWIGLGKTVTGGQQVQLWTSPDGLVPWTPAVVIDYDDTESATMQAIAANPDSRAVLVGSKGAGAACYAMTSPVLTP